jgi:folate-binding protein YgfZ
MTTLVHLADRGVLALTGADRVAFLQGLVSADVSRAAPGRAVWSAHLTPQGRWLAEFFLFADGERLLLDGLRATLPELLARLSRHRLRARVELADVSAELSVYVAFGGPAPVPARTIAAPDPRLPQAGWRLLCPTPRATGAMEAAWRAHRIGLGLPDSEDLEPGRTLLLEAGFDELGAISWDKGCYLGQEVTARSRYRGLIRRRLLPVTVQGPLPAAGTPVLLAGTEVGSMRSGIGQQGLAMLRLEALRAGPLLCGEAQLTPRPPAWMRLP